MSLCRIKRSTDHVNSAFKEKRFCCQDCEKVSSQCCAKINSCCDDWCSGIRMMMNTFSEFPDTNNLVQIHLHIIGILAFLNRTNELCAWSDCFKLFSSYAWLLLLIIAARFINGYFFFIVSDFCSKAITNIFIIKCCILSYDCSPNNIIKAAIMLTQPLSKYFIEIVGRKWPHFPHKFSLKTDMKSCANDRGTTLYYSGATL